LDDPRADQQAGRGGQTAEHRSAGEERHAGEEDAPAAQQVAQPPGEQQQTAERALVSSDEAPANDPDER